MIGSMLIKYVENEYNRHLRSKGQIDPLSSLTVSTATPTRPNVPYCALPHAFLHFV